MYRTGSRQEVHVLAATAATATSAYAVPCCGYSPIPLTKPPAPLTALSCTHQCTVHNMGVCITQSDDVGKRKATASVGNARRNSRASSSSEGCLVALQIIISHYLPAPVVPVTLAIGQRTDTAESCIPHIRRLTLYVSGNGSASHRPIVSPLPPGPDC